MNVCVVYGWRSSISTSNSSLAGKVLDLRRVRGKQENMFITAFAGTLLGADS